ncbi:ATP-dependent zinc metalloprotease FtsH [Candidatus Sumerlaeota bacterium]|nr:ATP-dependent zinc metalloprotease FtsH [Candidatus Sumerlaeota bacterium]
MNSFFRSAALWIVIIVAIVLLVMTLSGNEPVKELGIREVIDLAQAQKIKELVDNNCKINGIYNDNGEEQKFKSQYLPQQAEYILAKMVDSKINYKANNSSNIFQSMLIPVLLPLVLIIGFWFFLMRSIQGSGNKAMSFGKSRARLVGQGQTNVTFDDVAGVDEAKEELQEIVEFLKDPQKFSRLGAKIPKGVLLHGPPGTGKTLLAKAVAGEASVPFFSISGSDFVEMFVGVGASRVRDLFEQAKKHKPCLIFMDEIDAVGRQRFAGVGGGHDEREQTLNQLLVEMDGFNPNEGIILVAATNRADVLDKALLRPGRFDRRIVVGYPDVLGREKILEVHLLKVKCRKDVDVQTLARATTGFCGADLANMINEAALLAARRDKDMVGMEELEEAKDRVIMGPERRSVKQIERDKEIVAFHEAGHALCAKYLDDANQVHKVTIVPRGMAMGLTSFLPTENLHNSSRRQLRNELVTLLGGRAAEEIRFGEYTSGAANDIQRVTALAHRMICELGMSDRLGPRSFGESGSPVFLGRDMARERDYSEALAARIDEEVEGLVKEAYETSLRVLREHKDVLDACASHLLERETLSSKEIDLLMEGKALDPLVREDSSGDSGDGSGGSKEFGREEEQRPAPPPLPKLAPGDLGI